MSFEQRIRLLSSIFAIEICAYSVMHHHLHLVIKLNPSEAQQWNTEEVLTRWSCLFKGAPIVQRYLKGDPLTPAERTAVSDCVVRYQKRLQSISWFMKCLSEPITRQAKACRDGGHTDIAGENISARRITARVISGKVDSNLRHYLPRRPRLAQWPILT